MREGGVVQQAPKIVYKLVLEVDMINVSCWKLKRNTDENRAISEAILFNGMRVLLRNFQWHFFAFDGEVFIFSQHHFAGYLCKKDGSRWQYCKNNNDLNLHGIK